MVDDGIGRGMLLVNATRATGETLGAYGRIVRREDASNLAAATCMLFNLHSLLEQGGWQGLLLVRFFCWTQRSRPRSSRTAIGGPPIGRGWSRRETMAEDAYHSHSKQLCVPFRIFLRMAKSDPARDEPAMAAVALQSGPSSTDEM